MKLGMVKQSREITHGSITRVLAVGFSLVILVLLFGGSFEFSSIMSIQRNALNLVHEENVTRQLIESLQSEQETLSKIFYTLTGDPDTANPAEIAQRLDAVQNTLARLETTADPAGDERAMWNDLLQASHAFGAEARRLLAERDSPTLGSRDLFRVHEEVVHLISGLVARGFQRISQAEKEITNRAVRFNRESITLIFASLVLALICSIVTARKTDQLLGSLTWQEKELARVSWQMVENQETVARRFSHELHDELGQTLAAAKANLTALSSEGRSGPRLEDTHRLVEEAIRNVRQLSQLLRPIILDDFGLDAGLNWLCEGFMQRTGIEVDYKSNIHERLPDEMETHLFRIAQEALTNIARHAHATKAQVELRSADGEIRLSVSDNGAGMPNTPRIGQSLGMTGMRARARAVGGVFSVGTAGERGVRIEARVPMPEKIEEEEHEPHPHLAG
ncbi:MAG: sensor histidine kinase [Acidobacteriota bacterium]|nr:sensor histidine kinase [Acidobacteriota bacterium]